MASGGETMTDDERIAAGDYSRATVAQVDDFPRRGSPDDADRMRDALKEATLLDDGDTFADGDEGEPIVLTAGVDVRRGDASQDGPWRGVMCSASAVAAHERRANGW